MKLPTPSAPFSPVYVHGESITIETEGKVLVLPSGNPNILPLNNEYTLNSNRLSIAESPFGGLKGPGSPDYCVGTVNIIEGDGVYLQDVSGTNSSKTLSAGKLKELNLLSVDTVGHSITEEFIVKNTSVSNNPTVIDDCETVDNWVVQTGRGTITLETNDKISGSGAIKLTVGGTYAECYIRLNKSINISSVQFICFDVKGPIGKTGQLYIYDSTGKEAYWNLGTYTGNWQRFVLPLSNPNHNTGINYNLVNALRFDIDNNPVQNDVLLIDNICGDVARPTYLEIQVPDYLADTSAQIYTHNGTAYQLCRTCKLDSAYASVSDTDANCTLADGTKFSDVYGTGNGRSVFPKGESGQSKNGSLTGSSITYSQNKGTLKRIGLRVDLPPAGTVAPNFSAVRLKIVTYYAPNSQGKYSATYQFSDTTSASTGLQNLAKPWIALYDPDKTEIDFFLHTYRPKQLEFKKDESGNIHELKLFPGNGQIYHGRIIYSDLTSHSYIQGYFASNYFADNVFDASYFASPHITDVPKALDVGTIGSLSKFLQSYGMVI